jgi:hypothetical protein
MKKFKKALAVSTILIMLSVTLAPGNKKALSLTEEPSIEAVVLCGLPPIDTI